MLNAMGMFTSTAMMMIHHPNNVNDIVITVIFFFLFLWFVPAVVDGIDQSHLAGSLRLGRAFRMHLARRLVLHPVALVFAAPAMVVLTRVLAPHNCQRHALLFQPRRA